MEANLVPLCGSGTTGCHGALHGTPHVIDGERWTAERVRLGIGRHIREGRADVLEYLTAKIGRFPALDHLDRLYP